MSNVSWYKFPHGQVWPVDNNSRHVQGVVFVPEYEDLYDLEARLDAIAEQATGSIVGLEDFSYTFVGSDVVRFGGSVGSHLELDAPLDEACSKVVDFVCRKTQDEGLEVDNSNVEACLDEACVHLGLTLTDDQRDACEEALFVDESADLLERVDLNSEAFRKLIQAQFGLTDEEAAHAARALADDVSYGKERSLQIAGSRREIRIPDVVDASEASYARVVMADVLEIARFTDTSSIRQVLLSALAAAN
jgi:hypothetical protein